MAEVVQRALGALSRFFKTLWMFVVAYLVSTIQPDPFAGLLTPTLWLFICYIYHCPESQLAAVVFYYFRLLGDDGMRNVTFLILVLLVWHGLLGGSPVWITYLMALTMVHVCYRQYLEEGGPAPAPVCPGLIVTSGATPEPSAEPGQPTQPEGSAASDPSDGPSAEEAVPPKRRARSLKNILWSFLCCLLKLGFFTLLTQVAINGFFRSWALKPVPMSNAPRFRPQAQVQASKTQSLIQVSTPEFITTWGSPCQVAPTPTPIAKSTWRAEAVSTTMPTPVPEPSPTTVPGSEPVAVPDKPLDLLKHVFGFEIPHPRPLLAGYFGLPLPSQYAVIVPSLVVVGCLAEYLPLLAAHAAILVIGFFAAAAFLPLLFRFGFTPEQSLVITLAIDLVLTAGTWWAVFWLKDQAEKSTHNAAGLARLATFFKESLALNKQAMDDAVTTMTVVFHLLRELASLVTSLDNLQRRADEQDGKSRDFDSRIESLFVDVYNKADYLETSNFVDEIFAKIRHLETSKGDAELLLAVQGSLQSLVTIVENLQAGGLQAARLEAVHRELEAIDRRGAELQSNKASAGDLAELADRLEKQASAVSRILEAQGGLTTGVATLRTEMDKTTADLGCLGTAVESNGRMLDNLGRDNESSQSAIRDLMRVIIEAGEGYDAKVSQLELENAGLRRDYRAVQDAVADLKNEIAAIKAGQVKPEHLQQLRDDAASDAAQKVDKLRSETGSQHGQVVKAHRELEASVATRFADSKSSVADLGKRAEALDVETRAGTVKRLNEVATQIWGDFGEYMAEVNTRLDDVSKRIDAASDGASKGLQLVEAIQPGADGSLAQRQVADYIRARFDEFMEQFMQSQRERLRAEIHEAAEEFLGQRQVQDKIYANFIERQKADHKPPGDPPGVISGGRPTSPGVGPSNSPAAITGPSDHGAAPTGPSGDDDPLGDPPGVISGGQAALPGDMSSDETTTPATPAIPEGTTTPDDVEDHQGTRGVPLGDPPGVITGRRATGLVGTPSDAPSGDDDDGDDGGDGPPPPGEEDDDVDDHDGAPQPEEGKGKAPCEPDNLTYAQLYGPAEREQPGGEQAGEETNEEDTDDHETGHDTDHHDDDDDKSDDKDPSVPPPRSGGNEDNARTEDKEGTSGLCSGLANSRHAPSDNNNPSVPPPTSSGNDDNTQTEDKEGSSGLCFGLANSRHAPSDDNNPSVPPPRSSGNDDNARTGDKEGTSGLCLGLAKSRHAPSDDNDPSGPPPGSGGNGDDAQAGDKEGTSGLCSGLLNSRHAPGPSSGNDNPQSHSGNGGNEEGTSGLCSGLLNSRHAPGPSSGNDNPRSQSSNGGNKEGTSGLCLGLVNSRHAPGPSTSSDKPHTQSGNSGNKEGTSGLCAGLVNSRHAPGPSSGSESGAQHAPEEKKRSRAGKRSEQQQLRTREWGKAKKEKSRQERTEAEEKQEQGQGQEDKPAHARRTRKRGRGGRGNGGAAAGQHGQ